MKPKEISNPFSTGGGGVSYEQLVSAYYMVGLLTQDKPLGLKSGITKWIKFQSRHLGATVDDLLVQSDDGYNNFHIQIQIKHSLAFSKNKMFQEVISDAWFAFTEKQGWKFDQDRDRIGVIISSYPQNVSKQLLPMLETARTSDSEIDFQTKISTAVLKSDGQRKYYALFKEALNKSTESTITDKQVWLFLKCFVVIRLELEMEGATDASNAWNSILKLAPNNSSEVANSIFNALVRLAAEYAPLSGAINLGGLQGRLYNQIPSLRTQSEFFDDFELELQKISSVYVAPTEYAKAKEQLSQHKFVILTGPAHIGKTATACQLALDFRSLRGNLPIFKVGNRDDLSRYLHQSECILILDDCFGTVKYSPNAHGENLHQILGLSKSNYVILTSRDEVFSQAQDETRLEDNPKASSARIRLQQGNSYSDDLLVLILEKHLTFMQSNTIAEQDRLNEEQILAALQNKYEIVHQLKFPHNIDIFCQFNLNRVGFGISFQEAIEQSKRISKVIQSWAKSLSADSQWFIFLVALLPGIDCNVLQSIYQELAIRFNFHVNSVQFLVKHHYAFLSNHLRPQFSHPSYEQAIIELLREEYALQIGKIVDFSLNQVLLFDTLAIGRCDNADFSWPRTNENHQLDIRNYLNQFIETYNYLINSHFSKIYESLPPYNTHKAAALILINTENTAGQLSIVETEDASTIFMEHPDNLSLRIHELMRHRITVNLPIDFWEIKYSDLQMRSPQLHALSILRERVENAFKKNRIQESWAITYYRIESALHHLCTGLIRLEANPSVPFSTEMIEPLFQQFKTLTENRPDGWPEFGWNNMLESSSKQILGLERAVRTLEKQKKVYSGPLLTQPDLQPSGYSYMAWARYSAPQMTIAIRRFFDLVFSAYRQMVEINFPSLANKFERYKQKDIKILGALTYKSHFGSEMSRFYFLPKDFPLQDSGNFEIYVECDLDNRDPNIIPFRQEIIKRFSDAEASGPLQRMGLNPSTFISGKSLIEYVYKWVKEDLDEVMGWQAVGNQRQHHQNRNAASFELPPQHSLYWDMHQFVDPRDMSDWPSLSL